MLKKWPTRYFILLLAAFAFLNWQCLKSKQAGLPLSVVKVVSQAGINKPELMDAIGHYLAPADSIKKKALYWLIANMDGNYSVYYSIRDSLGKQYYFPPKNFSNYIDLKHSWDSEEQKLGNLIYQSDSFLVDNRQLKADFLIKNLDQAFKAYKSFPWSKHYDFHSFCRWILPYRCANESVVPFREHFLKKFGDSVRKLNSTNTLDVALLLNKLVNREIDYKDSYNKEANVQHISQLEHAGVGNYYDINIYKVKVLRSFGIAAALDYSPFLADSSFGYAWTTVILPDHSEWMLEFNHKVSHLHALGRLAKVYRRTFEKDTSSLYAIKDLKQTTPPFLGHYYYRDISNQLFHQDVKLPFYPKIPYAFLAVFNDGEWHPIDWSIPKTQKGTIFHQMGRGVVYLPVSQKDTKLSQLGSPFILDSQGQKKFLTADFSLETTAQISMVSPHQQLQNGKSYTLYVWKGNWLPLYQLKDRQQGISLSLPANGLFLLSDGDIDFSERIFVVDENGTQVFY